MPDVSKAAFEQLDGARPVKSQNGRQACFVLKQNTISRLSDSDGTGDPHATALQQHSRRVG
jgi:hypothetical protein